MPLPVSTALLGKLGDPCESTLWGVPPVAVQVQVTVCPAATVSCAGFWVPLWPLWKKMLPTVTVPTAPPPPPPPMLGPVVPPLEHRSATAAAPASIQGRVMRLCPPHR